MSEEELENYAFNQYNDNKYLANLLRKRRKFDRAFKYYTIASLHLRYYKLIRDKINI